MPKIQIKSKVKITNGWKFVVDVDEVEFEVEVGEEYWRKLNQPIGGQSGGGAPPEELIKRSFEFLLKREPKESILKKFSLSVIENYFPEFESEMKRSKIDI